MLIPSFLPEMPSTLMFLEKLRGVTPVLYDSTTTQQLQAQQQQQQQQQLMEEQQHGGVDQLAQFPCKSSFPLMVLHTKHKRLHESDAMIAE